jgi:branched-chain amino acid aminotransferase
MYFNLNGLLVNNLKQMNVLNRSFRYGDGFFESILYYKQRLPLWKYHKERISASIAYIFSTDVIDPTFNSLENMIIALASANKLESARVRITYWRRGDGNYRAYENKYDFLIETMPLEKEPLKQQDLISYGYCTNVQKPMIRLSNFKTNASLYFVMAQQWAQQNNWREVILLNTSGKVCEGSYHNIFIIQNGKFITPPIAEGCIDGSARKYIIELLQQQQYAFEEKPLTKEEVDSSDALFFTNGIRIITPAKYDARGVLSQLIQIAKNALDIE